MADLKDILLQKIKDQGDLVRKLKAAKESSEKGKKVQPDKTRYWQYDLEELNNHLAHYSYICGYEPTNNDSQLLKDLGSSSVDFSKFCNLRRWWYHMRSFNDIEQSLFKVTRPPEIMILNLNNSKTVEQQVSQVTASELS